MDMKIGKWKIGLAKKKKTTKTSKSTRTNLSRLNQSVFEELRHPVLRASAIYISLSLSFTFYS